MYLGYMYYVYVYITANRQHQVVHFSWHPICENRISTVSPTGTLKDNKIFDKLPMVG